MTDPPVVSQVWLVRALKMVFVTLFEHLMLVILLSVVVFQLGQVTVQSDLHNVEIFLRDPPVEYKMSELKFGIYVNKIFTSAASSKLIAAQK